MANDFRRSIRQSIRMELGNLEDELDVEQAPVITSIRSCPEGSHSQGMDQTYQTHSSTQWDASNSQPFFAQITEDPDSKDKRFVFSPRGLLGSVFVVFLIGALLGSGAAVLTILSIRDD